MNKPGQHLGVLLCVKPREVFVVSLDEYRSTWHCAPGRTPLGEIPGALVIARSSVDFFRIRPDAEVPDVQYPIEARAESRFECEHVIVEALDGTVNVAGCTDQHKQTP